MGTAPGQGGPELALVPGSDSAESCASYPCASVRVSGSGQAQISLGLGIESVASVQPATYYTDLLRVANPTRDTISVTSVALSGVAARQGDLGAITVFYCLTQTDAPRGACPSFTATSSGGGAVFKGADQLAPGAVRYIELAGFAGPGAHPGDSISFQIEVTSG